MNLRTTQLPIRYQFSVTTQPVALGASTYSQRETREPSGVRTSKANRPSGRNVGAARDRRLHAPDGDSAAPGRARIPGGIRSRGEPGENPWARPRCKTARSGYFARGGVPQ